MKRTLPTPPAHAPCTASPAAARPPAALKLGGEPAPMAGAARDSHRSHDAARSSSRAPGGGGCGGAGAMVFRSRSRDAARQSGARGQLSQDIERELELVEKESAKLREQQARLDEEEREIDAKLRHLEMGMLRRKEALVRDREKRKMDYLRDAGQGRDCPSDGEARGGAKAAASGQRAERPRTAPEQSGQKPPGGRDSDARGEADERPLQRDPFVPDAHYKAQSPSCYAAEPAQCRKPYGDYPENGHRGGPHFRRAFAAVEFPTRDGARAEYATDGPGVADSRSPALLGTEDGCASTTPAMFVPMTSSPSDYHKHSYLSASDHALVPNSIGASRSDGQELGDRFSVSQGCQSGQISSYQQYSHKQLHFGSQKPTNGQMGMEPKLLTNYEVIDSHDPLMMSPTSTDSLGDGADMRLPLDDRGSIMGSPLSSISAESFYTDLDQPVPRNYVLIDDISELTGGGFLVDGMDVQNADMAYSRSLPSATELNDFVGSAGPARSHSRYGQKADKPGGEFIAVPVATRAHPFRSLSDEATVDPLERQMKRQMQQGFRRGSESLDHVVSPLMFDLNDNKYRNASRSDKYSMSRITLEKEAAKQLTPPYMSSQSKSRKPDLDGRIFKFPSLEKGEDADKDFLAYKNSSPKMERAVVLRDKRLQGGDASANFRQSIKAQQSFHGLPHLKTNEICIPRGIGSRPRSSSVSGLDGITSRMSGLYDLEYKRSRPCSVYNMEVGRSLSPGAYGANRSRPASVYGVDETRARPASATDFNRSRSFSITGHTGGRAQPPMMAAADGCRMRPSSAYGMEEPKARPPPPPPQPDCGITSSRSCSFSAYRSVMSRTRSSSFSGLDVRRSRPSTVYDLDFCASKQSCAGKVDRTTDGPCGAFNAVVKMRAKPSSLPISQGARRLSLTEQNSDEDESPLSPVVQPMGMARAAAGPLPPISADSREQFGSCHSLPEADRHAKDLHRRSLDCGFTRMVDNLNHALGENDVCYTRHGDGKKIDRCQDVGAGGGGYQSSNEHHQRQFSERLQKYDFPHSRIRLSQDSQERSVSGNGFGVRVVGGKEIPGSCGQTGAYISSILQGGAAEKTGQLMEGMQVLEWNGMPLMGRTYEEVQHIIAQQDEDLELCVRLDLNMLLDSKTADSSEQVYSPSAEKQKCMGVDPQQLALELRKVAMRAASDSNDDDLPATLDSPSSSSLKREHYDKAPRDAYAGASLNGRAASKPDRDALNRAKLELLGGGGVGHPSSARPPPAKSDKNGAAYADAGCSPKHSPSPGSAPGPGQRPPRLADCQQSTVTSSGSCSSPKQSSESSGQAQTPVDAAAAVAVCSLSPVLQQTHPPQHNKGFYPGPEPGPKSGQQASHGGHSQQPPGPYAAAASCAPSRSGFSAGPAVNRQGSPPPGGFAARHPYAPMPGHPSHHANAGHHGDDRHLLPQQQQQHLHNVPPAYCTDRGMCAPMDRSQSPQMPGAYAAVNGPSPRPAQPPAERNNPQAAHNASHLGCGQSPRHGHAAAADKGAFQQMATTSSPACAVPRPVLPAHGRSAPQAPLAANAAFCSVGSKPAPPVPERNQSLQSHGGCGPEGRQAYPLQPPQSPYRAASAVPRPSHPAQDRSQGPPPPYSTIPRPASPGGPDRNQLQHAQPPACSPAKAPRPAQRTPNAPPPYGAVPRPYPLDAPQAHYSHGAAAGHAAACGQVVRKQPQLSQATAAPPTGPIYAAGFAGADRYRAECRQAAAAAAMPPAMPHACCAPVPPAHAAGALHGGAARPQAARNSGAPVEAASPPKASTVAAAPVTKKQQDTKQPHEPVPPAPVAGDIQSREAQPKPELGEIQLRLRYDADAGDLVVGVLCARGLTARNGSGNLDPFVKVYLLPGKGSEVKRKTKFVHKSLNPEWNQTVVYHGLSLEELEKRTLEVAVWDYDRFATNHFLGEVNIALCKASNLDDAARWHRLQVQSDSGERRKRSSLPPDGKQPQPPELKGQHRANASPDAQERESDGRKDGHKAGGAHCAEAARDPPRGGGGGGGAASQDRKPTDGKCEAADRCPERVGQAAAPERWPACGSPCDPKRFGADERRQPEKKAHPRSGGDAPPRHPHGDGSASGKPVDSCPHGDGRCRGPCAGAETDVWVRMQDRPPVIADAGDPGKGVPPKAAFAGDGARGRAGECVRAGAADPHAACPYYPGAPPDGHRQAGKAPACRAPQAVPAVVSQQPERAPAFSHCHNGYLPCPSERSAKPGFQPAHQHGGRPHSPCPPPLNPSPEHLRQSLYAQPALPPKDGRFGDYQHAPPHYRPEQAVPQPQPQACHKKTHIPRATGGAGPPQPAHEEAPSRRPYEQAASREPGQRTGAETPAPASPAVAQPRPRESQQSPQHLAQQQQQQLAQQQLSLQQQVHHQSPGQPQQPPVNADGVKPSVKRKPLLGVSAARKGELSLACWPSC